MSVAEINWAELSQLSGSALKSEVFSVLQQTALEIQTGQLDDPAVLAVVPRLAELMDTQPELASFGEVFSALARSTGLWNYVDKEKADSRDELAAEIATVDRLGLVLHREQMSALNTLLSGQNLILSAPTSFGKSILIDALLLNPKYQRVAIVLPTIALLDEFRRRLIKRFGDECDVLMHHSEREQRSRVIFLGTQERLINRDDLGTLDLVVVDEFYKLDPARKDERSVTLNAAVYRLLSRAKQFFFLGPNIESVQISSESRWGFAFLRTRFSTVAVNTFDLKGVADKEERLHEEIVSPNNWPALVFVSSPDKANTLSAGIVSRGVEVGAGSPLAEWMVENYGGQWELSDAVAAGVGVHHGRIPRALASRFVTLFNQKEVPILICTSTLIEGVNTAAKSVLIYDKTIARSSYDFFTFSNIKGRAGRLGQHHVGQVFLFHQPPSQETVEVTAPLFNDLDEAPDEYVVHISEDDSTPAVSDRVSDMAERAGMTHAEIRRFSSLGLEVLVGLRSATNAALRRGAAVEWDGWPTFDQILGLCQIVCDVKKAQDFGCGSARQLAFYIRQLRSNVTMRGFYGWHSSTYKGDPRKIDNVFKFLRAAEYGLPELFAVIELFVRKAGRDANYGLFLAELPRWFRDEVLKILEEQGVPMQISERFLHDGDTVGSLGSRLRALALREDQRLTPLECQWVLDALPS
jgi:hypothetical protein